MPLPLFRDASFEFGLVLKCSTEGLVLGDEGLDDVCRTEGKGQVLEEGEEVLSSTWCAHDTWLIGWQSNQLSRAVHTFIHSLPPAMSHS